MGVGSSAGADDRRRCCKSSTTPELCDMRSISLSAFYPLLEVPPSNSKAGGPHTVGDCTETVVSPGNTTSHLFNSQAPQGGGPPTEAAASYCKGKTIVSLGGREDFMDSLTEEESQVRGEQSKTENSCQSPECPSYVPTPEPPSSDDKQHNSNHAQLRPGGSGRSAHSSRAALMLDAQEERKETTSPHHFQQPAMGAAALFPALGREQEERVLVPDNRDTIARELKQTSPPPVLEPQRGITSPSTALAVLGHTSPTVRRLRNVTSPVSSAGSHDLCLPILSDNGAPSATVREDSLIFTKDEGYGIFFIDDTKHECPTSPSTEAVAAPQAGLAKGAAHYSDSESRILPFAPFRMKKKKLLTSMRSRRGSFVSFGGEVRMM